MNRKQILTSLAKIKPRLIETYGLKSLGLFGSYARGDQVRGSDVDLLVEFEQPIGMEIVDLAIELESVLSAKVDLVTKPALRPAFRQLIEREIVYV